MLFFCTEIIYILITRYRTYKLAFKVTLQRALLTKNHFRALWPLHWLCSQPGGEHLCWQSQETVAGQIQVGEVPDVRGGLHRQHRELVVVQIEKSETGHIHEGFPRKGREGIPVQTKFFEVEQASETVRVQGGQRVERHPQEFQTREVVEGFTWYPLDGRLLNPQFGRISREPDRHNGYLRIVANNTPERDGVSVFLREILFSFFYRSLILRKF